jgi:hypothetical protein
MTKIQDGTGSGRNALVTPNNRLATSAIVQQEDHFITNTSGKVWSYTIKDLDPTAADDYFFYVKNTSTTFNYNISDLRIASTVAGQLEINVVSGTAVGDSTPLACSRLVGAAALPNAVVTEGVDITGLTGDGTLFLLTLEAAKMQQFKTSSRIIIPPGQAVGLLWGEATGVLSGTISVYETPLGEEI